MKDKKDKLMFCGICTNSRIAQMSAYAEMELVGKGMTFTAKYGLYKPRKKTYKRKVKIHLRSKWIFNCYKHQAMKNHFVAAGKKPDAVSNP